MEARHVVPDGWKASLGQVELLPVQLSTASQEPAEERHTVVDDANASSGQSRLSPGHDSAASQVPVEERQTVPELPAAFSQNFAPPVPVWQTSVVHGLL